MLNITDLEKRWFKYKIKSFLPYIIVLSLLIIIIVSYFLFTLSTEVKKDVNSSFKNNIIKKQTIPVKKRQTIIENNHSNKQKDIHISTDNNMSARVLAPSMDFMTTFTQQSPYMQKQEQIPQHKKIVQKKKNNIQRVPHKQKKVEVIAVPHITIIKQNTAHDIKNILSRFQKDKNPALSLFLAKKYYELKNYEKASQYALITNQLNSNIEDSWIIFAKTLVKTHHKQKAINVLNKYIKSSHSTNAALLLHSIRTGEFK